jgi:alanine or glycine:cation symporter, AGCS family
MVKIVTSISEFLWGIPLIVTILFTGLFFTVASSFFQFRFIGHIFNNTFGMLLKKKNNDDSKGILTPFEAVTAAIGSSVGVGNIGGVATAIAIGGPGALFWMWVTGIFGMLIKMVEVTLAVYYRNTDRNGNTYGGPTYYMEKGLGEEMGFKFWYVPAFIFGVGIFSTFFITVQNYTISEAVGSTFKIDPIYVSFTFVILVFIIISGGIKFLGKVASKLVPLMCALYVLGAIAIILMDFTEIPKTFSLIFSSAFNGQAATGGFTGSTFAIIMRVGVARSVYSNEAGWGTSPMIHATSKTEHPLKQGIWGCFEVFVDTMIICTLTALVIINTGIWSQGYTGSNLTLTAFESKFGMIGRSILAISIFLFALTTATGWYTYYEVFLRHVLKDKFNENSVFLKIFRIALPFPGLALTIIALKSGMPGGIVWAFADIATGVPTFINVVVILLLSKKFLKILKDYKARYMGIGTIDSNFPLFYEDKERDA